MKLSQFQRNVLRYIGIRSASFAVRILLKTLRIEIRNGDSITKLAAEKKNFISAFWHGSMIIGWYIHRNENVAALVSKSKDGEVLATTLEKWNYHVVRGSSSIGGHDALKMMTDLIKENFSLTITPDGPRGPIHKMKAGAIVVAQRTTVPLFLSGIGIKKKVVLKSWDRFEVPSPFTKVVVIYSDPIIIDEHLSRDETDKKIGETEILLNKLQKEALELC
jgi:lysophospholipid acyltransferase (LPLAT)-like uncharacterized protein